MANGKVCYIEIPASDDTVGEVSGTWVTGRKASTEPGLLISIMVDSVAATVDAIVAQGGKIVQPMVSMRRR